MGQQRFDPWVIAAIVVGVALRFVNLGAAPLWFDEMYTYEMLHLPWHGYLGRVMHDNQAPIYYAAAKAWTSYVGFSPWMMRIPGLLASAACVPLAAAIARTVTRERGTRAVAWVVALSPFLIQHAQDARPYALLAAVAAVNLLVLIRYVEGRSSHLGVLWVVSAFAVVATHYYGLFFLAGEGLALLILRPRPLRGWLPAGVVAGAACTGLVLAALQRASGDFGAEYVFGGAALPGVVWSLLTGYTLMPTSEQLHMLGPSAVLPHLPIALATVPAFAIVTAAGLRAVERKARVVLLATFGFALLAPFVYRLVAGVGVHPRYFAAAAAPILIVTGAGMAPAHFRSLRGIATVVLALVMAYATFLHLRDTGHGREDVTAAGQWLDAHVPPDEEILVTSIEMEAFARFTWPHRRFRLYPTDKGVIRPERIQALVEQFPFQNRPRAIFLVGRAWVTDPDGKLQSALAHRYAACPGVEVQGIRIHCFQPQAATVANADR